MNAFESMPSVALHGSVEDLASDEEGIRQHVRMPQTSKVVHRQKFWGTGPCLAETSTLPKKWVFM